MNNHDKRFDDPNFVQAYNYLSKLAEEDREQYSEEELNQSMDYLLLFSEEDRRHNRNVNSPENKTMALWAQLQKPKHHRLMFALHPRLEEAWVKKSNG